MQGLVDEYLVVSTHAPVMGATVLLALSNYLEGKFQPTRP